MGFVIGRTAAGTAGGEADDDEAVEEEDDVVVEDEELEALEEDVACAGRG